MKEDLNRLIVVHSIIVDAFKSTHPEVLEWSSDEFEENLKVHPSRYACKVKLDELQVIGEYFGKDLVNILETFLCRLDGTKDIIYAGS